MLTSLKTPLLVRWKLSFRRAQGKLRWGKKNSILISFLFIFSYISLGGVKFLSEFVQATIPFANREEALGILGEHDIFLKAISEEFEAKVSSRGTELNIYGEAKDVEQVANVLNALLLYYRHGGKMTLHEVRYAISLVKANKEAALLELFTDSLMVSGKGKVIRPKTIGQKHYIDLINSHSITFGIGPAGTGKTYLAVVMAVAALQKRQVERLIITRPAVEAGEKLGYLPGDLQEKIDPYLRPIYDALQDILGVEQFQKLMLKNIIEIAPLAYMRGRTLERSFIILDEAQNTTSRQMKMFLTRLGFGSKMIINGDLSQVDLPLGSKSGLAEACHILKNVRDIAIAEFGEQDVIRHDVVARIIKAYDEYEQTKRELREAYK